MTEPFDGASVVGDAPIALDALLRRYPVLTPPVSTAGAAVSIVLREGQHEIETLLIVRAANPDDPGSGQVAFPGGRVAEGDGSLLTTALRELEEEVGLTAADLLGPLRFVGAQPARAFGLTVGIFAAALGPVAQHPRARSPEEVATVFWLPRSALAETRKVTRTTALGSAEVRATVVHGEVLWGFTRRVLRQFFGLPTEDEPSGPAFARPERRGSLPEGESSRSDG